jgi:large subunit ribosomal protein L10
MHAFVRVFAVCGDALFVSDGGAMPKREKVERVAELRQRIEGSAALLLTEYRGLTVSEIMDLRRSLRETETTFRVVKNTLMQRAVGDAGVDELKALLTGPSAVAFVSGDPVAAAKAIKTAAKQFPTLMLKGGYMDGQVLSAEDANGLADLESRDVMLSKIAGMMKSEMSRAAAMFVAAQSRFLSVLEAYKEKLPAALAADETKETAPAAEASIDDVPDVGETTDQPSEPEPDSEANEKEKE